MGRKIDTAWERGSMGAWEKILCHSGHDEVVIRNPAMPAIRLVTRSFMRRVEPWRRMMAKDGHCEARVFMRPKQSDMAALSYDQYLDAVDPWVVGFRSFLFWH